jgi:hypothetical protein
MMSNNYLSKRIETIGTLIYRCIAVKIRLLNDYKKLCEKCQFERNIKNYVKLLWSYLATSSR